MTNAPTTSPELLKSIDVVYERMNNVKNQKNELFELLNNMDEFSKILGMMKNGEIVTKETCQKLEEMIKLRGISSKLHDRETKSNEECIKESMDLTQFILNYPYALDAENFEMFGDGKDNLFKTEKYNYYGLVQKLPNEINIIDNPMYDEPIRFVDKKNGIVVKKYRNREYLAHLGKNEKGEYDLIRLLMPKDDYLIIKDFDHDDIAFVADKVGGVKKWGLIKKVHPYEGKIEIHNLVFPEVEQDPDKIGDLGKMEFDEYNACGAIIHGIGKVILRKKFYKGECDTISAFRKGRRGEEIKLRG